MGTEGGTVCSQQHKVVALQAKRAGEGWQVGPGRQAGVARQAARLDDVDHDAQPLEPVPREPDRGARNLPEAQHLRVSRSVGRGRKRQECRGRGVARPPAACADAAALCCCANWSCSVPLPPSSMPWCKTCDREARNTERCAELPKQSLRQCRACTASIVLRPIAALLLACVSPQPADGIHVGCACEEQKQRVWHSAAPRQLAGRQR